MQIHLLVYYPHVRKLIHAGRHPYFRFNFKEIFNFFQNVLSHLFYHPVLISMYRGQYAVRSQHWRYIRYPDGSEELYDHRTDPHEWSNLAAMPGLESVKQRLGRQIPSDPAPDAPERSAYTVDPATGRFILKKK